jgi:uncharacterized protein YlxW (UPF0749 family)
MSIRPFTKLSILLLLTGVTLGLFLTSQWRAKPSRITSPLLPYTSLRETQEILQSENTSLKKQIGELQKQITQDQEILKKAKVGSTSSLEELEKLKRLIALTPLKGEGVNITLADSAASATFATTDTIVHAADLRDLINLLWASGASGIAINNQRISIFTSIDCIVNTILINNSRLTSPFTLAVVGNQKKLLEVLNDPSYLYDLHRRKKLGLIFSVESAKEINLPPFNGSYVIQFAKTTE